MVGGAVDGGGGVVAGAVGGGGGAAVVGDGEVVVDGGVVRGAAVVGGLAVVVGTDVVVASVVDGAVVGAVLAVVAVSPAVVSGPAVTFSLSSESLVMRRPMATARMSAMTTAPVQSTHGGTASVPEVEAGREPRCIGWTCSVHCWPSHQRSIPGWFGSGCHAGGSGPCGAVMAPFPSDRQRYSRRPLRKRPGLATSVEQEGEPHGEEDRDQDHGEASEAAAKWPDLGVPSDAHEPGRTRFPVGSERGSRCRQ